jgi:hypothetical protein
MKGRRFLPSLGDLGAITYLPVAFTLHCWCVALCYLSIADRLHSMPSRDAELRRLCRSLWGFVEGRDWREVGPRVWGYVERNVDV